MCTNNPATGADVPASYCSDVIEAISDGVFIVDDTGVITSCNRAAAELTGRSPNDLIGRNYDAELREALGVPEAVFFHHAQGGRDTQKHEMLVRGRWLRLNINPIGSPETNSGCVYVMTDVTAEHDANERLIESNKRISDVLNSITDCYVEIDREWRFVDVNATYERLIGKSREELSGQLVTDVLPAFESGEFHNMYMKALAENTPVHFEAASPIGPQWYEVHAYPSSNGIRIYLRDITARKAAEQELHDMVSDLEAFTYSVSHDLRAPLRAMNSFSRLLIDEYGSTMTENARHYAQMVIDGSKRMAQLIDDLLQFSKVSRQQICRDRVNVHSLFLSALDELQPELVAREVNISIGTLPPTHGDTIMLRQAILNLLSNALKYTRKCQTTLIEAGSWAEAGERIYYVKDNGVGFDMKYADRVFGVFQRLHRADEFEGTGLGLAIVHRIVTRHGGRVWVEAAPDAGATFYFTLPQEE